MRHSICHLSVKTGLAALALSTGLLTPALVEAQQNSVVNTTILAEPTPRGYFANAVVLEYDKPIDLRNVVVPTTDVTVHASRVPTCAGASVADSGARTVVGVYSNSVPRRATAPAKGNYLIIELSQTDALRQAARNGCPANLDYTATFGDIDNRFGRVEVQAFTAETTQVVSPVIEDFRPGKYTSPTFATTLQFRLFSPERYVRSPNNPARKYPLVVFLHGGGERGDNNFNQIAANMGATTWATPEFQADHQSFVLAPQVPLPETNSWATPNIRDTVHELILGLMAQYPIDPQRIYVTGLSLGSFGSSAQLNAYPEFYAGALMVSGNQPVNPGPPMRVPVWMATAFDDSLYPTAVSLAASYEAAGVSVARASWPGNLFEAAAPYAEALIEVAAAQGSHVMFTTYMTGTNVGAAHNTGWIATYSNPVILNWLFTQKRP